MGSTLQSENLLEICQLILATQKRKFLGGSGYIVTFKDKDDIIVDESDLEKVESVGLKWINLCKTKDLTLLEIHELVDDMYNDEGCDSNASCNNATLELPEDDDIPHYVTPSKNVRKEPRIDVSICHTIMEESQSGMYYHLALQYHKTF